MVTLVVRRKVIALVISSLQWARFMQGKSSLIRVILLPCKGCL